MSLDDNTNKIADILAKANALPDRLDTSDATAAAEDIVKDKTAYVNGEKVTGSREKVTQLTGSVTSKIIQNGLARFIGKVTQNAAIDTGKIIGLSLGAEELGDANDADVAKGKTYTSAAGFKRTGTKEEAAAPSGSGGGETWEAINAITLSDAVNTVTINTDSGGNAIALKKVRILVEGSASTNQDLFFNNSRYLRANVVGSEASVGALSAEPFCGKMYCYAVTNINANYGFSNQIATTFSDEITITEIKLIVNNNGKFSAGTKFTIQGVRA